MFMTSPHAIASPSAARAPRATTASPVATPRRRWSSSPRIRLVESDAPVPNRERSAHRAFRFVAACPQRTKKTAHRIADEPLDGPALALQMIANPGVVGGEQSADVLGVWTLRPLRRVHDVTEERRDDLLLDLGAVGGSSPVSDAPQDPQKRNPAGLANPQR